MDGKDIESGLVSNPFDLKQIFYSNLLLLGFDSEAEEASFRIPFNRDMFLYPNKKAMEIVLHFLFCNLDPGLAFQEFRDCWPVKDKKMEQQFRKSCNSWLTRISKEEPDSNLPRIGPSLFLSPGGERFYEMLFYFSCYVVRQVMVRDHSHSKDGSVPHVSNKRILKMPHMMKISSTAILVKILSEKNRLFEEVQCDLEIQEDWKSHAMSTTKEHRKLCKGNRELERKLNPMGDNVYLKEKTNFLEETEQLCRTKQLQEVRELWSKLKSFYENTKEKRAILNEILEHNEANFNLDGCSVQLQIPDVFTTKYRRAIQMKNIKNTYQEGNLSILSLTQLSNLSLHELKEKIRQDGVPNFEQFTSSVKHEVRTNATYLAQARNLSTSLQNDAIPEMKKSIEKQKEDCCAILDETDHSPVDSLEPFDFGLGLLPTTPSPSFTTPGQLGDNDFRIPEISLKKTPKGQATPDVIESLTSSIRELVVRGNHQSDKEFPPNVPSERTIHEMEKHKTFVSKIPKPVNRKLSRTPDISGEMTTAVTRRSLTSTKKTKMGDKVNIEKMDARKRPRPRGTGLKAAASQKISSVELNSSVSGIYTRDDLFSTPLATGTKSVLQNHHSSARNILAEKIASSVFSNGHSSRVGSSQSSSGENTPLDLALADPVGNLHEQAFLSRDLIPRTPFKKGDIFSDTSDDDDDDIPVDSGMKFSAGSLRSQPNAHDKTTPSRYDASSVLQTSSLKSDVTTGYNVPNVYSASPRQFLQQNTSDACASSPLTRNQTASVSSNAPVCSVETIRTTATEEKTRVSCDLKDVMLQYQRLKEAEELRNSSNLYQPCSTDPAISSNTCVVSEVPSLHTRGIVTTNPVLLRYQQWKNAQAVVTSNGSILNIASKSTQVSLTPVVNCRNQLLRQPVGSQNSFMTSPSPYTVSDTLTPVTFGHDKFPRHQRPEVRVGSDDCVSDVTGWRQQGTSITFSKDFDTPMMSSMGNYFNEFGNTPLEYIAPPEAINRNSVHLEAERDCVRSRLSFDFATPTSWSRPCSTQQLSLNTPCSRKAVHIQMDDVNQQLIPVNIDDLLADDNPVPLGGSFRDFSQDIAEPHHAKAEQENKTVENKDSAWYSTPSVKVGQLIEFD